MSIRRPSPEAPRAVAPQPTSVPHSRLDLVLRAGVGAGAGAPPSQEATAAEMERLHELVFLHGHEDDFFATHDVELTSGIMGTMKMGYFAMQFLNKGIESFKNPKDGVTRAKAKDAYESLVKKMKKRNIPAGMDFESAMKLLEERWKKHMPNKRKTAWSFYMAIRNGSNGSAGEDMGGMSDMDSDY